MPRLDTMLSSPTTPDVLRCAIATHAAVRATPEMLAQWRRQPPPVAGQPVPTTFLKHSDDQTVALLAAVHQAIVRVGWLGRSFADWGAVAAPSFFGRQGMALAVQRYAQEGAWGVSPHVVPHQSLHAPSGTVSQLLKMHGPNFGINGGPMACNEAFLVAATLLAEAAVPGLWLLLSGHERECVPIENGKATDGDSAPPPVCEALALALVLAGPDDGLCLRIGPDAAEAGRDVFSLAALIAALTAADGPVAGAWTLPAAGSVELEAVTLAAGNRS
jgi:hypothetical protein